MIKKYYYNILTIMAIFLLPLFVYSQDTSSTTLKDKQRAILIYNFARQIGWNNINGINNFKIGVIGNDEAFINELKKITNGRNIHGKRIVIKKLSSISSIKNISLLYVHKKFNYDISTLLKKVSKKNILIISENYKFNESMINIINTGQNFQYELNEFNIQEEGFIISPDLIKNATNSESKWQEFYIQSDKYLTLERNKVIKQGEALKEKEEVLKEQKNLNKKQFEQIKTQKEIIVEQFKNLDKKKDELEKLEFETNDQNKRFKQKIALLDSLETYILIQEKQINVQKNAIINQGDFLKKQLAQINIQKEVLSKQKNELSIKRKQILIAFILVGLTGLVGFFVLRSNRLKKRLNDELTLKNIAIEQRTEALEAQNTEMEQFAYIASHDLKEPLNTISSFIQLIEEDYKHTMDEIGQQSVVYISEASVRMKTLIASLLEYSRLGKVRNLELVDCTTVFNDLEKDLQELINSSKTKLTTTDLPNVYANKIEMRLLFQNLITNAIKFIPEGKIPIVQISCKKQKAIHNDKEYWKFSISDNGIGIKQEHLKKVFAIFQRLHNIEEYEGAGIGLAHCKKIVKSLKGEIGVISEFGKGSTFWFVIPCQKPI